MTAAMFNELLRSVAIVSMLLLVGTFLRAKISFFQKMFLPASVIGGFIGLVLGPPVLHEHAILRFSTETIAIWSYIPGILIIPIFAAVPLGMFMGEKKLKNTQSNKVAENVIKGLCIYMSVYMLQNVIGFATNIGFMHFNPASNIYRTFGFELSQGFWGGHGTAGAVGQILESLGISYWKTAQGVTVTTATVGLVGGMIFGIMLINAAARHGRTAILKKPGEIPHEMLVGYTKDIKKQASLGRETTFNSSIETISFHLALILVACGIAYYIMDFCRAHGGIIFKGLPVWIYAMVVMLAINFILIKFKLSYLVDARIKSKITGSMSDFAITAAIASVPVEAVATYFWPLFVMCTIGFVLTYILIFKIYDITNKDDYAFERSIIIWGAGTGVIINGMMLLKICDPDYETPALSDFSLGFAMTSVVRLVTDPIVLGAIGTASTSTNLWINFALMLVFIAITFGSNKFSQVITRNG